MSDEIRIIGIHSYGYHGVFEHEQKIGQDFYVDIHLHLDLLNAAKSDSLSDTVDYSSVCEIVIAEISGPPVYLVEKLAGQIGDLLLAKFPQLKMVAVTVHKPQAPVSAEFLDISVTIERTR
jgi:dihydroneopterin aldolase